MRRLSVLLALPFAAFPLVTCGRIAAIGSGASAKRAAVKSELRTFKGLLETFHLDCGRFPTRAEGLNALNRPPRSLAAKWHGPYTSRRVVLDPWANPYAYDSAGPNAFSLTSYGADGALGGTGENADLMVTN